nr:ankycorbin-like [Cherax quadricarinatus]
MADLQYKLQSSAKVGDAEGVERALEEGAPVSSLHDEGNREPLHHACAGGHVEVVKLLLAHNADVNAISKHGGDAGATPVHLAAEGGYSRVLGVLLAAGADANSFDYNGMQPVHRAATRGRKKVLEVLRDHGCDLSSRVTTDWSSTLHHAAAHGDLELVKWLVYNGVRYDLTDKAGRIAQNFPRVRYHRKVLKFLRFIAKQNKRPHSRSLPGSPNSDIDPRKSPITTSLRSTTTTTPFHPNRIHTTPRVRRENPRKVKLHIVDSSKFESENKAWPNTRIKKTGKSENISESTPLSRDKLGDIKAQNLPDIIPQLPEGTKAFPKKGEKPIVDVTRRESNRNLKQGGKECSKLIEEKIGREESLSSIDQKKTDLRGEKKKGPVKRASLSETGTPKSEDPRPEEPWQICGREKEEMKIVKPKPEPDETKRNGLKKAVETNARETKKGELEKEGNKAEKRSTKELYKVDIKKADEQTSNKRNQEVKKEELKTEPNTRNIKEEVNAKKKEETKLEDNTTKAKKDKGNVDKIKTEDSKTDASIIKTKKDGANVKKTMKEREDPKTEENAISDMKGETYTVKKEDAKIEAKAMKKEEVKIRDSGAMNKEEELEANPKRKEESRTREKPIKIKVDAKTDKIKEMARIEEENAKINKETKAGEPSKTKEKEDFAANTMKTKKEVANARTKKELKAEDAEARLSTAKELTEVKRNENEPKKDVKVESKCKLEKDLTKTGKQIVEEQEEARPLVQNVKPSLTKVHSTVNTAEFPEANGIDRETKGSRSKEPKAGKVDTKEAKAGKVDTKEEKASQVDTKEAKASKVDTKEAKASKVDTKEAKASKVDTKETKASKVDTKEAKASKVDTKEAKASKVDTKEAKASKVDTKEAKASKVDTKEAKASKVDTKEAKASKVDTKEAKASKVDTKEAKASKVDTKEAKASKVDTKEAKASKIDTKEAKASKVDTKEPKAGKVDAKEKNDEPKVRVDQQVERKASKRKAEVQDDAQTEETQSSKTKMEGVPEEKQAEPSQIMGGELNEGERKTVGTRMKVTKRVDFKPVTPEDRIGRERATRVSEVPRSAEVQLTTAPKGQLKSAASTCSVLKSTIVRSLNAAQLICKSSVPKIYVVRVCNP